MPSQQITSGIRLTSFFNIIMMSASSRKGSGSLESCSMMFLCFSRTASTSHFMRPRLSVSSRTSASGSLPCNTSIQSRLLRMAIKNFYAWHSASISLCITDTNICSNMISQMMFYWTEHRAMQFLNHGGKTLSFARQSAMYFGPWCTSRWDARSLPSSS